jgi:hypothetical protein
MIPQILMHPDGTSIRTYGVANRGNGETTVRYSYMYPRLLIHIHSHTISRLPDFVHLNDKLTRGTLLVILHRVPYLHVQLSRVLVTFSAREGPCYDGAFVSSYWFMEEEYRLFPVRRHALGAGAETHYPLFAWNFTPSLARSSFLLESSSERPHLRNNG